VKVWVVGIFFACVLGTLFLIGDGLFRNNAAVLEGKGERPGSGISSDPVSPKGRALDSSREPSSKIRTEVETGHPADQGDLHLTVLYEDGTALGGAIVAVFRASKVLEKGTTDKNGILTLNSIPGETEIAVLRDSVLLHLQALDSSPGTRTIRVPLGSTVSGTVLVDGKPPREPLLLTLLTMEESPGPGKAPFFLSKALGLEIRSAGNLSQKVESDGSFRFAGLPHDWHGRLGYPNGYSLEGEAKPIELAHPATGLLIQLRLLPAIYGRVVDPNLGNPVENVRIQYRILCKRASNGGVVKSKADGRFRIPLPRCSFQQADLAFRAKKIGFRDSQIFQVDPDLGRNLGDVVLEPVRDVSFRVLGMKGVPVPGAIALAFRKRSDPTDKEGHGLLEDLPQEAGEMTVHALGYQSKTVSLPVELPAPIELVLERTSRLEVRLLLKSGDPAPGLKIRFSAKQPPFLGADPTLPDPMQAELGASENESGHVKMRQDGSLDFLLFTMAANAQGRVLLTGIRPRVPLDLDVQDAMGHSLAQVNGVSVPKGDIKKIEIKVPGRPREFQGRVIDSRGNPIPQATVTAEEDAGIPAVSPFEITSNHEGRFQLENIYGISINLFVKKNGFASGTFFKVPFPEDGQTFDVVLDDRGKTVLVEARDPAGRAVPSEWIRVRAGSFFLFDGPPLEDGRFHLTGLPDTEVLLAVTVGGQEFEQKHQTRNPEAVIEVPVGSVLVTWNGRLPEGKIGVVELRSVENPQHVIRKPWNSAERAPGSILFRVVFPGTYHAQLVVQNPDGSSAETWTSAPPAKSIPGKRIEIHLGPKKDS